MSVRIKVCEAVQESGERRSCRGSVTIFSLRVFNMFNLTDEEEKPQIKFCIFHCAKTKSDEAQFKFIKPDSVLVLTVELFLFNELRIHLK